MHTTNPKTDVVAAKQVTNPWDVKPTKHTNGPWKWSSVHGCLTGEFGQAICWHSRERGESWAASDPEVEAANQRLLAAAPQLLGALQLLYADTADYIATNNLGDIHHNYSMAFAQRAITLALTGKTA